MIAALSLAQAQKLKQASKTSMQPPAAAWKKDETASTAVAESDTAVAGKGSPLLMAAPKRPPPRANVESWRQLPRAAVEQLRMEFEEFAAEDPAIHILLQTTIQILLRTAVAGPDPHSVSDAAGHSIEESEEDESKNSTEMGRRLISRISSQLQDGQAPLSTGLPESDRQYRQCRSTCWNRFWSRHLRRYVRCTNRCDRKQGHPGDHHCGADRHSYCLHGSSDSVINDDGLQWAGD